MICVGAGAAGLQIAYKAERLLENVELQIYEKNHDIGGTWLENRYPGCTCDIPSHSYQFTWEKNPNWSHFYSSSEEIWRYFKHVSTKYDLEKYVKFNTKVQSARWDEDAGMWRLIVIAADGSQFEDECEILVNGSGVLKYVPSLVEACSTRSLTIPQIAPTNIRTSQASKSLVESSYTVRPGMTTTT
jgi:cation diffusion facilitator CzcD-associated flavoprotein CzcO